MPIPILLRRKSLEDDLAYVERQLAEHPDPYDTVRLMWEQRRDALREELAKDKPDARARVALLFQGNPVLGSEDIRLDFAIKVLDGYQGFVSSLMAERAGAELGARGKLPRSFSSKLFIRDMVRGSVGFLLEEAGSTQYDLIDTALREIVEEGTRILRDLSTNSGQHFESRMNQLAPRTIAAIKKMAKILHDSGAETRVVGEIEELALDHAGTASLYSRLNDLEIVERPESIEGVLLGLFPERQQYELQPGNGTSVFYGPVSETLDAKYIADVAFARSIILKPATAVFTVVSIIRAGVVQVEQRILEEIKVADGA
jgi:hypothetical protein